MIQIGKPERFALEYELLPDPDRGGEAFVRASWGALQIWVGGRNLTAGLTPSGERVVSAVCPLSFIAEWLIEHWNPLLHEERLPTSLEASSSIAWYLQVLNELGNNEDVNDALLEERQQWWTDHGLGAALPSYRIPDIHFRRWSELIEISWDDQEWRSVPSGIVLTESPGVARLPIAEVVDVFEQWCRSLLKQLALAPDPAVSMRANELLTRLDELRSPLQALDRLRYAAGQQIERMAKDLRRRSGIIDGNLRDTVRALLGAGGDSDGYYTALTAPVLLFRSAAPNLSNDDLNALVSLCDKAGEHEVPERFSKVRRPIPCPLSREETTLQGYELALEFRNSMGIPAAVALTGEFDIESLIRHSLGVRLEDCALGDSGIEGAAVFRPKYAPVIAINPAGRFTQTSWGRRMTLGHEICHLLHDSDSDNSGVGIVSNEWAPYLIERRANAFAAMLLAPEPAIAHVLKREPDLWSVTDLQHAMRELGIGATTLLQQLRNLRWLRTDRQRDIWLNALSM